MRSKTIAFFGASMGNRFNHFGAVLKQTNALHDQLIRAEYLIAQFQNKENTFSTEERETEQTKIIELIQKNMETMPGFTFDLVKTYPESSDFLEKNNLIVSTKNIFKK